MNKTNEPAQEATPAIEEWEVRLRQIMGVGAALLGGTFTAAFLWLCISGANNAFWRENTLTHVPTIIGLPFAALASLLLVLVLRSVSGNIELKALGFEFRGAARTDHHVDSVLPCDYAGHYEDLEPYPAI